MLKGFLLYRYGKRRAKRKALEDLEYRLEEQGYTYEQIERIIEELDD